MTEMHPRVNISSGKVGQPGEGLDTSQGISYRFHKVPSVLLLVGLSWLGGCNSDEPGTYRFTDIRIRAVDDGYEVNFSALWSGRGSPERRDCHATLLDRREEPIGQAHFVVRQDTAPDASVVIPNRNLRQGRTPATANLACGIATE
jgi:hypothetical protein